MTSDREIPPPSGETTDSSREPDPRPDAGPLPEWIGEYRIIRRIDEGAMGIVYEAERQEPRMRVALKVVKGGPYVDAQHIRLFRREVEVLARLKHPGIAYIHDAGRTDDGHHFFTMELVRGRPLSDQLGSLPVDGREQREEIRLRIELFLKICDAIVYAHQRAVVHLDLKPRNIHVIPASETYESRGPDSDTTQVKILDFGLARLVERDPEGSTRGTMSAGIRGTLAYMSPEQARAETGELDVRSDVYSLGVILFQMLTGELPYQVRDLSLLEAVRVICEQRPRRPGSIVRTLGGDLETIILKALEKDPDRRYQSATAFRADLWRYLGNQPIAARPPSTVYQVSKLIQRHRGAFAFAVTVLVLLVAFAVTMAVMFEEQRQQRLRAERETRKVEQIHGFVQGMLGSVDPIEGAGRNVTVREILDEAAVNVESDLADQPEIRAAVESTLGNTYRALGHYDQAAPLLESALAIRREILRAPHEDIARSLHDLAVLEQARGGYADADRLLDEALRMTRTLFGPDHAEVATVLASIADLRDATGRYEEAESLYREVLAMRRRHLSGDDPALAGTLAELAVVLRRLGRYEEAEALSREALALYRSIRGPEHLEVAQSLNNLAWVLSARDKSEEAEASHREALRMKREILGEDHPAIATSLDNLAQLLQARGEFGQAETLAREALTIRRSHLGPAHPLVVESLNNLGSIYAAWGRREDAEVQFRTAVDLDRQIWPDGHPDAAVHLSNLGAMLLALGRHEEAEPYLRDALAMTRAHLGDDHEDVPVRHYFLARALMAAGEHDEAAEHLEAALALWRPVLGADHDLVRMTETDLLSCLRELGRHTEAESLARRRLETARATPGDPGVIVAPAIFTLASIIMDTNDPVRAEPLLRECLELRARHLPGGSWEVPQTRSALGGCLMAQRRYAEAESLLTTSYHELRAVVGDASVARARDEALGRLIRFHRVTGSPDKAAAYERELKDRSKEGR